MIKKLSIGGGVLFALLGAVATFFSGVLMKPKPLPCFKKVYKYCDGPKQLKLAFEDVTFETKDKVKLSGWWVKSAKPESKKVILFTHGRGGNRIAGMRFASSLSKAGFHFLMFDQRASGKSQKVAYTFGPKEAWDINAAAAFAKKRGMKWVGIMGTSVGAGYAILAMAENKDIKAAFLEGAHADPVRLIARGAKIKFGLPKFPIVDAAVFLYEKRIGKSLKNHRPIDAVKKIKKRPIYFVHGMKDKIIPASNTQELYKAAVTNKKLWLVKEAGHVRVWNKRTKEMEEKMTKFFMKHSGSNKEEKKKKEPTKL